ncbi:hypothetical protein [Micromonospora musae]|uniref:hypothetical protein n=1 Tax=Micromonospora musae TaxID=1894970 RepID=UPI00341E195D
MIFAHLRTILGAAVDDERIPKNLAPPSRSANLRVYTHLMPASEEHTHNAIDRLFQPTPADGPETA